MGRLQTSNLGAYRKRAKSVIENVKKKKGKQFYMYAFSNAEGAGLKDNSLSNFTNTLSNPLSFSDKNEWKMSIRALFMSNNLISEYDTDFLQIKCNQLSADNNSNQIISLHSKKPSAKHLTTHTWIPRNVEWFTPISNYIESLTFTLLDNHSEQILLAPGQPTIILLEFKKISSKMKEFIVRVSSKPTLQYMDNKPNIFRASLPLEHSFFAQSPFEMAVNSITYTPQFKQTYYGADAKIGIALMNEDEVIKAVDIPLDEAMECSCDDELIFTLSELLKDFQYKYGKANGFPPIEIEVDRDTNKVSFFTPSVNPFAALQMKTVKMNIPYSLGIQLGMYSIEVQKDETINFHIEVNSKTKGDLPMNVNALIPRSQFYCTQILQNRSYRALEKAA